VTFSKNYAGEIWAYDFVQTYDLFFRTIFVFFIIELASRQVVLRWRHTVTQWCLGRPAVAAPCNPVWGRFSVFDP